MVRLNVTIPKIRSQQGMTLIEILIALVIAGILAAFTLPSLMGILKKNELKSAQDQVQTLLRDAQRQAMRRSKACEIVVDQSANPPEIRIYKANSSDTTNDGCLSLAERRLPASVKMNTNLTGTPKTVKYSFKGTTTLSDQGTIVLYDKDMNTAGWTDANGASRQSRCVVISAPLGILRAGIYSGNPTSTIQATKCKTSSSTL